MKTIAINFQHENWEDDSGAHDVFIVDLEDADYEELCKVDVLDRDSELYQRIDNATSRRDFPITIDDALSVWYRF
jgi:hypothetical protein